MYTRLAAPVGCPVVTVTGTNGKGSTCAMLDAILSRAGYRVGLYTSPHLLRYNERVRIGGREATDDELLAAFNAVEDARLTTQRDDGSPITLTYFEFGTLAALWLFARAELDAMVLEVGLGGRLDAVNIVDADVAILTSVGIDHTDYLGPTREDIGREKAGVFRAHRPAICGDLQPPASVTEAAHAVGTTLLTIGRDYGFVNESTQWRYWGPGGERYGLPVPVLRGAIQLANAAGVLAALDLLRATLPVSGGAVREGLLTVDLPGRFQVLPGRPAVVLDVAHNPEAAHVLAEGLGAMRYFAETFAVFGVFADKDVEGIVIAVMRRIDRWYVAPLPGPRSLSAQGLRSALERAGVESVAIREFANVGAACAAAREAAGDADRIVVFGSFLTVAGALMADWR